MSSPSDIDPFKFDRASPEYQAALRMVRKVLGTEKASQIEQSLSAGPLSEQIGWFFTRTWGALYGREDKLPLRDRALTLIGIDLALGRIEPLQEHLKVALHAGVTRNELAEVMFQAAFYVGVPILPMCMRAAREIFESVPEEEKAVTKAKDTGVFPGTLDHTAMVVRDWRAAAENYSALMGLKRWRVIEVSQALMTESMYYGKPEPCTWISAFAKSGDTLIELCQPVAGKSIFDDFLREHGEGMQHVGNLSHPEPEKLVTAWTAQGVRVGHYFNVGGAMKIYYLDTRAQLGGMFLEVVEPASFAAIPGFGEDVVFE
jgi:methylmalonyl-CoA/ethylmalonyl-CoA epimerase